eukprot:6043394-Pyramimonas_sp.AAC.1
MKDSRAKRSPPEPCLPSPRHNFPTRLPPSVPRVSLCLSGFLTPSGNSPGFVSGTHGAGCVLVRVQAAV